MGRGYDSKMFNTIRTISFSEAAAIMPSPTAIKTRTPNVRQFVRRLIWSRRASMWASTRASASAKISSIPASRYLNLGGRRRSAARDGAAPRTRGSPSRPTGAERWPVCAPPVDPDRRGVAAPVAPAPGPDAAVFVLPFGALALRIAGIRTPGAAPLPRFVFVATVGRSASGAALRKAAGRDPAASTGAACAGTRAVAVTRPDAPPDAPPERPDASGWSPLSEGPSLFGRRVNTVTS
jgi:hypothetical protein